MSTHRFSTDKSVNQFVKSLVGEGWSYQPPKGRHPRIVSPNGQPVVFPTSPSDWRVLRNMKAKIKRIETQEGRQ